MRSMTISVRRLGSPLLGLEHGVGSEGFACSFRDDRLDVSDALVKLHSEDEEKKGSTAG